MTSVRAGQIVFRCIAVFGILSGIAGCANSGPDAGPSVDPSADPDADPICSDATPCDEDPCATASCEPSAAATTSSLGQFYLDWEEVPLITSHTGTYAWQVIQSYMREHVDLAQLEAANPDMRLFMYFETAGAYADATDSTWPSGMPYQWVKANHPDWIVKDRAGKDITFWGGDLHLYDVGNPAYQDEWARRAIDYAQSAGFHGIFGDDVNVGESFRDSWSAVPAKYQTNEAWTQAVESFLNNVTPKLKAAGLTFVPNVASAWNSDRATQVRWATLAGAYGREHYQSWQGDTQLLGGADWAWMAALHRDIAAAGIPIYAFPHGGGAQATAKMRYTRYSYLLWHEPSLGGGFAYSTGGGPDSGADPYNAAWAVDLGAPSGPAVQQSTGVWTRQFANGKIVVDSNAKTAALQ